MQIKHLFKIKIKRMLVRNYEHSKMDSFSKNLKTSDRDSTVESSRFFGRDPEDPEAPSILLSKWPNSVKLNVDL